LWGSSWGVCISLAFNPEQVQSFTYSIPCSLYQHVPISQSVNQSINHKMKIINSPLCIHCDLLQTLSHMLANCIVIQKFWFEVISWWKNHSGECLLIDDLRIILTCISLIITSFLARDTSSYKGSNLNPQALFTFLNLLKTS